MNGTRRGGVADTERGRRRGEKEGRVEKGLQQEETERARRKGTATGGDGARASKRDRDGRRWGARVEEGKSKKKIGRKTFPASKGAGVVQNSRCGGHNVGWIGRSGKGPPFHPSSLPSLSLSAFLAPTFPRSKRLQKKTKRNVPLHPALPSPFLPPLHLLPPLPRPFRAHFLAPQSSLPTHAHATRRIRIVRAPPRSTPRLGPARRRASDFGATPPFSLPPSLPPSSPLPLPPPLARCSSCTPPVCSGINARTHDRFASTQTSVIYRPTNLTRTRRCGERYNSALTWPARAGRRSPRRPEADLDQPSKAGDLDGAPPRRALKCPAGEEVSPAAARARSSAADRAAQNDVGGGCMRRKRRRARATTPPPRRGSAPARARKRSARASRAPGCPSARETAAFGPTRLDPARERSSSAAARRTTPTSCASRDTTARCAQTSKKKAT